MKFFAKIFAFFDPFPPGRAKFRKIKEFPIKILDKAAAVLYNSINEIVRGGESVSAAENPRRQGFRVQRGYL